MWRCMFGLQKQHQHISLSRPLSAKPPRLFPLAGKFTDLCSMHVVIIKLVLHRRL